VRFSLDGADTRRAVTGVNGGGPSDAYAASPDHRVIAIGGTPVTYTTDGVRTLDGRYRYELDALGRVTRLRDRSSGVLLVQLEYDALGRAAAGTIDGQPFEQWYDTATPVHELVGAAGAARQRSQHPLWPLPFAIVDATGPAFMHQDAGWSTMCVTDAAGAVLERHRYDLFGASAVFAADGVTPLTARRVEPQWRGMRALGRTTLFSTPDRIFDSASGVFTSRDPLLYLDSPSPYSFAGHNPVDFADPSGFAKEPLSKPPEAKTGWDKWFNDDSKNALRSAPHPGDLWRELGPVDTGSTLLNYAVNTVISASNIAKGLQNVPFELLYELDDAMRHSRFGVEWQGPMQFMQPLMRGMGLMPRTVGTLTYLRGLLPTAAEASAVAKTFTLAAISAGGVGAGSFPVQRAPRVQHVGKTPVLADSLWAKYQRYATGTRFEAIFRLMTGRRNRDVLADALTNSYIAEAKFGNMGQMWNPEKEEQIIAQARAYLEIADALGLRGVRYMVSTTLGTSRLRMRFRREFPAAVRARTLSVWWVPPPD
jgi:RHS repeat-associated protein